MFKFKSLSNRFARNTRSDDGFDGTQASSGNSFGSNHDDTEPEPTLHPDAHEDGGLACNNEQLAKQQREAITQWIKSMGKKLLTGSMNLINTPFPVIMFEPRSYLEKLADVWVYPQYLSLAAEATDPVLRMQYIVAWFIAGLHHSFEKWKKPFNPILGETWEAMLSDGSNMYMEQISHHPPVSAFHLEGPGGSYSFRGLSQPTVSVQLKHYGFKTVAKGFRYVQFPDGTRVELFYPSYFLKNVVYSNRPRAEVDGQAVFVDVKHGLKAVLTFGPIKGGRSRGSKRTDAVSGFIYDYSGSGGMNLHHAEAPAADVEVSPDPSTQPRIKKTPRNSEGSDSFESASESEFDGVDGDEAVQAAAHNAAQQERLSGTSTSGTTSPTSTSMQRAGSGDPPFAGPTSTGHAAHGSSRLGKVPGGAQPLQLGNVHAAQGHLAVQTAGLASAPTPGLQGGRPTGAVSSPNSSSQVTMSHSTVSSTVNGAGRPAQGLHAVSAGASGGHGNPPNSSFMSGLMPKMPSMLKRTSAPMGVSGRSGQDVEGSATVVATLEGSWLSHLDVNGQRLWTLATSHPDVWRPVANPLPSDTRYRQDLAVLLQGDVAGSQVWKEKLELLQRADKKLRSEATGLH